MADVQKTIHGAIRPYNAYETSRQERFVCGICIQLVLASTTSLLEY